MRPFISICIPAYKNTKFLDTLLRSIEIQSFRDHEVIVSDDSPDNEVEILCKQYAAKFPLVYHKNSPAKGSPANWNMAISLAKGAWIKMMHDDDWFADENSLGTFAEAAGANPSTNFIFSGFSKYEHGKIKEVSIPGSALENRLKSSPLILISNNHIGHPSTTLVKNDRTDWYDERTKWVVDFEFYIRCLEKHNFFMIRQPLVNIGVSEEQITKSTFGDITVVVPEHIYLLNKMGVGILKNISVYDHFWRLFRNFNIRSIEEVEKYSGGYKLPEEIRKMLKLQFKIPLGVLKQGVFSKLLMALSFYTNRSAVEL